jgi:alpha-mannosidase
VTLSDKAVQLAAAKRAESGRALILRLFEPTGRKRTTTVSLPFAGMRKKITLGGFEIRSYRVDTKKRTWKEVNLLEK